MSKVYLEDSVLTDIADAIREKTGESGTITPANMSTEIESISGGGEPVIESKTITANGTYTAPTGVDGYSPVVVNVPGFPQLTFSGDLSYFDYHGCQDWLLENYSNYVTTQDVTKLEEAFNGSKAIDLSGLTINFKSNTNVSFKNLFNTSFYLKQLPKIGNINAVSVYIAQNAFSGCRSLRTIPNDWANKIDLSMNTSGSKTSMFSGCFSLREIPQNWLNNIYSNSTNSSNGVYSNLFNSCSSLDEILNLNAIDVNYTVHQFANTFQFCDRLKNFTFKTNNGTPYIRNWKKQTIPLETVGYASNTTELLKIVDYNSGITREKRVHDAASYEALKNDPDWWTMDLAYSRYNHDSAVETINSLPDTSAVSTGTDINAIRFKGDAGSATDGGAINTLTAEEIAVATDKGWTVTIN